MTSPAPETDNPASAGYTGEAFITDSFLKTMKNLHSIPKLAALAAMVLLCCSTLFLTTNARAQCPTCDCPPIPKDDAQYDSTPIPWHGADTCIQMDVDGYGDTCWVKLCYIYRTTSPTNYDYALTGICVDPGCGIDLDSTSLQNASQWLMDHNPQHFPDGGPCPCPGDCSTCHGNNIQWSQNFINCWAYCSKWQWQICAAHGWCIDAYWVCKDPISGIRKLCYDRSVHTTWQCTPGGQPPPCSGPPGWGTPICSPQGPTGDVSGCPSWMH